MARSWIDVSPDSDFSLANLPFGVVSRLNSDPRVPATIIGDTVVDLAKHGGFANLNGLETHLKVFETETLNAFARLGRQLHRQVRSFLQEVLSENTKWPQVLRDNPNLREQCLVPIQNVRSHLPMHIGDFSDFYGGLNHAANAGALFRGQAGALTPNFLHMPMAYHGRSSSIYVSGTPIRRPCGQVVKDLTAAVKTPIFEVCKTMDFELELGAFVCNENAPGERVSADDAGEGIFGFVLLNDWSARDVQRWEYVPLGPFNGKNFGCTISPWVVLADALEPYRVRPLPNKEQTLPYLRESRAESVYDLHLEVVLTSGKTRKETTICRVNAAAGLIWSFQQMLAHHTVTGCPMRVGDMLGSGTISGTTKDSLGCLLEQTQNGKEAITLAFDEQRIWLEDGDTVTFKGHAGNSRTEMVGFGECSGTLLPANPQ